MWKRVCGAGWVTLCLAVAAGPTGFQPGQPVEVRDGDGWSAATVVKREGRRYLIHRGGPGGAADEWLAGDGVRPATVPGAVAAVGAATPVDDSVAMTRADCSALTAGQTADLPPDVWSVRPDPAVNPRPSDYSLLTRPTGRVHVRQLLPCAGGAVVGFADGNTADDATTRSLERVGTTAGPARMAWPAGSLPMAASPSGLMVVCRADPVGTNPSDHWTRRGCDVIVYSVAATGAKAVVRFVPYPAGFDGQGETVDFMAAVGDGRILTCNGAGDLIAWDVGPGLARGVWRAGVGRAGNTAWGPGIVLSPGGKWVAAAAARGPITFVDVETGRTLGVIPLSPPSASDGDTLSELARSPSGRTLVARRRTETLVSFDVATGGQGRTVAVPPQSYGAIGCPADGLALLAGRVLIDANTGAVVSGSGVPAGGAASADGPNAAYVATASKVAAVRPPAHADGDAALALKPGTPVSLDVDLHELSEADRTAAEAAVRAKLLADHFVIVASADTVVELRTELGATHNLTYTKSPAGVPLFIPAPDGRDGETVSLTDKVTRITIRQGGRTVWEQTRVIGPAGRFPVKDGASLADAARATIHYDPAFLIGVTIPPYIAKPDAGAKPDQAVPTGRLRRRSR